MRTLDHIFYRGDIQLDHSFASHTENAKQASDHLPMVADFKLSLPAE
jgi:endonuclease/exonuclease/phosphatase family metal-dependent hydrolase